MLVFEFSQGKKTWRSELTKIGTQKTEWKNVGSRKQSEINFRLNHDGEEKK